MTAMWTIERDKLIARNEEVRAKRREAAERWQRRIELSPVRIPIPAPTRPIDLIQQVACWHGLPVSAVTGPRRTYRVIAARFDAIAAIYVNCRIAGRKLRLKELGRHFGGKNHQTIIQALKKRDLYSPRNRARA